MRIGGPAVSGVARELLACRARRLLQRGLQHEVLDRVAGEIKLGEGDQVGARRGGAERAPARAFFSIALKIAHDGVELRERELEASP